MESPQHREDRGLRRPVVGICSAHAGVNSISPSAAICRSHLSPGASSIPPDGDRADLWEVGDPTTRRHTLGGFPNEAREASGDQPARAPLEGLQLFQL